MGRGYQPKLGWGDEVEDWRLMGNQSINHPSVIKPQLKLDTKGVVNILAWQYSMSIITHQY